MAIDDPQAAKAWPIPDGDEVKGFIFEVHHEGRTLHFGCAIEAAQDNDEDALEDAASDTINASLGLSLSRRT